MILESCSRCLHARYDSISGEYYCSKQRRTCPEKYSMAEERCPNFSKVKNQGKTRRPKHNEYFEQVTYMTYRERMINLHPEFVDDKYSGGVKDCPGTYWENAPRPGGAVKCCLDCEACWNQKIKEN